MVSMQPNQGAREGVDEPDPRSSGSASALAGLGPYDDLATYDEPIGPGVPSYSYAYHEYAAIFTGCMEGFSAIG